MPKSIKSHRPSGNPPSDAKKNLLHFAFGETNCVDSGFVRAMNFLAIALISTLLFVLLSIKPVDDLFATILADYSSRLFFKTVLFFLLILLLDTLISNWREGVVICET